MSVREQDRQKNCSSRGLGLAAAAIGVGVGAALYYFFSKTPETPIIEEPTSLNEKNRDILRAQALSKAEYDNSIRIQEFRKRSWTLEECSICFEVILREHEVMTLPCTHNFHQACILPWLQERQTCPNCRKAV